MISSNFYDSCSLVGFIQYNQPGRRKENEPCEKYTLLKRSPEIKQKCHESDVKEMKMTVTWIKLKPLNVVFCLTFLDNSLSSLISHDRGGEWKPLPLTQEQCKGVTLKVSCDFLPAECARDSRAVFSLVPNVRALETSYWGHLYANE